MQECNVNACTIGGVITKTIGRSVSRINYVLIQKRDNEKDFTRIYTQSTFFDLYIYVIQNMLVRNKGLKKSDLSV
ncbi:hypothetical protein RCL_jg1235.t1 [Rhizophagus clarus]|uniref:Uncharacterized protein n=1 Tax=Rhizophagus clarus TaxID=94130 RepID=A0A8H3L224_9GLOM|nr:hypothetical protein RCL_jg1235.t1 [Rhizophagus clarus]